MAPTVAPINVPSHPTPNAITGQIRASGAVGSTGPIKRISDEHFQHDHDFVI